MSSKVDLKCVLLGRAEVGKTCLLDKFLHNRFSEDSRSTVGVAFGAKEMTVDKKKITLGMWDTAGSERYESMTRHYYKGAEAAIVCYDLTDAESWAKVKFWVDEIISHEESCIIAIVGTKLDLLEGGRSRAVPLQTVRQYAERIGAKYYETSALTGTNVAAPFHDVVAEWNKRPKKMIPSTASPVIRLPERASEEKQPSGSGPGCCSR